MFDTSLSNLLKNNRSARDADLTYISKDNEVAHEAINQCLTTILDRLKNLEEYTLILPGKIQYKPPGIDTYLSLKENLDLIYERLIKLENNV
jgi:hypothetical protein